MIDDPVPVVDLREGETITAICAPQDWKVIFATNHGRIFALRVDGGANHAKLICETVRK